MKSAGVHDDTTLLLGLDGVVVDRVELDPTDGCRVVHLATAARCRGGVSVVPDAVERAAGLGGDSAP